MYCICWNIISGLSMSGVGMSASSECSNWHAAPRRQKPRWW
jgi:hypothetical protein